MIYDILHLVPHRPPMVWVDDIEHFDAHSGATITVMKTEGYYWGPNGLRASSCLEFIAQSYGYCSTAHTQQLNPGAPGLKRAFLASFKDAEFARPERFEQVRPGDRILARYSGVRHIGSITMFSGEVVHNGEVICRSQLKVFCES